MGVGERVCKWRRRKEERAQDAKLEESNQDTVVSLRLQPETECSRSGTKAGHRPSRRPTDLIKVMAPACSNPRLVLASIVSLLEQQIGPHSCSAMKLQAATAVDPARRKSNGFGFQWLLSPNLCRKINTKSGRHTGHWRREVMDHTRDSYAATFPAHSLIGRHDSPIEVSRWTGLGPCQMPLDRGFSGIQAGSWGDPVFPLVVWETARKPAKGGGGG